MNQTDTDNDDYLPRFVSVYGKQLDYILGNDRLTKFGYFITLRFKAKSKSGTLLTDDLILPNFLEFLKKLNRKALNSKYKVKDKTKRLEIPIVGVEEKHSQHITKNHLHCILLKPPHIDEDFFIECIQYAWQRTWFGIINTKNEKMFDCTKIYSRKVIPYFFEHKDQYSPHGLPCTKIDRCFF